MDMKGDFSSHTRRGGGSSMEWVEFLAIKTSHAEPNNLWMNLQLIHEEPEGEKNSKSSLN